jgi:hypothetical protein
MAIPKTLLQIVNTAQAELGLPQSATVIGNTDFTTVQMLALLNIGGEELRDHPEGGWTAMQTEFNLVVGVPTLTTGDTTGNSPVIVNIPSTAGLVADSWMCSGPNIPTAARIKSVDTLHQVTLTMNVTGVGATVGVSLVFSNDTYAMPSDFKSYINRTWWDRTNRWELLGPDSPQMDQWHRSGIVVTGPRRHWRQLGKGAAKYRIWPQPSEISAPIQLVYEYLSDSWVNVGNAGTTFSSAFTTDADTPVLDDRALILALKYRFWQQKGYNYLPMQQEYMDWVDRLVARDGGSSNISLVKRQHPLFLSPSNTQDGFFPGPVSP